MNGGGGRRRWWWTLSLSRSLAAAAAAAAAAAGGAELQLVVCVPSLLTYLAVGGLGSWRDFEEEEEEPRRHKTFCFSTYIEGFMF